jgi:hypothetical protein
MDFVDIARSFLDFDACLHLTPVGQGNINDSYRLEVSLLSGMRQSYLLQRLNHQVFKNPDLVMRNMQLVADYLQKQAYSYQISMPLAALDGQYLQRDDAGNYWRLFPFFENTYAPEGIVDQAIAFEAARAYGAFAAALRDFPAQQLGETIPGFHDTQQRWAYFLQVLEEDPVGRAGNVRAEIDALFGIKPLFDKIQELRQVLPLRVTVKLLVLPSRNVLFCPPLTPSPCRSMETLAQ